MEDLISFGQSMGEYTLTNLKSVTDNVEPPVPGMIIAPSGDFGSITYFTVIPKGVTGLKQIHAGTAMQAFVRRS